MESRRSNFPKTTQSISVFRAYPSISLKSFFRFSSIDCLKTYFRTSGIPGTHRFALTVDATLCNLWHKSARRLTSRASPAVPSRIYASQNADSCTAIPMALFVLTVSRRFLRIPLFPSIVQASQFKVRSPEPITYHSSLENDIFVSDSSRFA